MTVDATQHEPAACAEAAAALDWFVNGTLPEDEHLAVLAHLRSCISCRRELQLVRSLAQAVKASDTVDLAPRQSLATLMHRIDTLGNVGTGKQNAVRWTAKLVPSWLRAASPPLVTLVTVQALAVLALAAMLVTGFELPGKQPTQEPPFRTTATDADVPARDSQTVRIRVVFAPELTQVRLLSVLTDLDATLVGGPNRAGAWLLDVPVTSAQADWQQAGNAVVDRVRQYADVTLAVLALDGGGKQ